MSDKTRKAGDGLEGVEIPHDLALDALAAIQALDALPVAEDFREEWLAGKVFGDEGSAIEWMKSGAGPYALPLELVFRCDLHRRPPKRGRLAWAAKLLHRHADHLERFEVHE
jgi:hypothetical protein